MAIRMLSILAGEISMRIHSNQTTLNGMNPYSAAAAKAIAAQRATDARKKLLKGASATDSALKPDEAFLVGRWMSPTRNE